MAQILLDFIQCHHCEKKFDLDDPAANDHWRECPNSPARETVISLEKEIDDLCQQRDELIAICQQAQRVMNDYGNTANWPPNMPMEYTQTINELRRVIAKAEGQA